MQVISANENGDPLQPKSTQKQKAKAAQCKAVVEKLVFLDTDDPKAVAEFLLINLS